MKLEPLLFVVGLLLVHWTHVAFPMPQAGMLVAQMPASPTPLVSALPATPANLPQLDAAIVEKFHRQAFILANNSDRAIVGLVVQWVYSDAGGHPITHNVRSDSFMQVTSHPVVLPHARLLVAPGAFVNEANIDKPHIGLSAETMDGRLDKATEGASGIAATIDIIIFDDGTIAGPNTTRFDTELQNRKLAATVLAKQIRNAIAKGEDPSITLTRIMDSAPSRDDTLGTWTLRYARMLSRGHLHGQLEALENLPEPPSFHK